MSNTTPRKRTFRELRIERGVKREQLALDLGISFSTLANLEARRTKPRIDLAERIYLYFGVPVGSIEWEKPEGASAPKDDLAKVA